MKQKQMKASVSLFLPGYEPANALFKDQVKLNEVGNVITDMNRKTSLDGVYAAGDICEKNLRQVVTAVSDGAIAATSLERVIEAVVEKHGLKTEKLKVKANTSADTVEAAASADSILSAVI